MRERLSIQRCRSVLSPRTAETIDDGELKRLRDDLYVIADVVTELYLEFSENGEIEDLLERAAILELDGGADRSDALVAAIKGFRVESRGD